MQNQNTGNLYVFEGIDGVGKTSLSAKLTARLNEQGWETIYQSFPGREPGTLGKAVYDLHHSAVSFEIQHISTLAMQTLHIAAHIDCLERRILPAIAQGINVVLDRYWWSTLVYGSVDGIDVQQLNRLIDIEKSVWASVVPTAVFLIQRIEREPKGLTNPVVINEILTAYDRLSAQELHIYPVLKIMNDTSLDAALGRIYTSIPQF